MKQVEVIAAVFVVITSFAVVTEGLQCWMGHDDPIPLRYKRECRGSCMKMSCGGGCTDYGCLTTRKPDGCTKCGNYNLPCCFCNKPLCNTGPVPSTDILQFVKDNRN